MTQTLPVPCNDIAVLPLVAALPLLLGFGIPRWTAAWIGQPYARRPVRSESIATPPSVVFGVVWSIVYLVLGALLYRLVRPIACGKYLTAWHIATLAVLIVHLLATFSWTPLYTSGRRRAALYTLVCVLATALVLQAQLINHDQLFVVLLAPYLAWLVFALHLNYEAVVTELTGTSQSA